MTDPLALGRDLLALAAACEARGQRLAIFRSFCDPDGKVGTWVVNVVGPERGRVVPFVAGTLAGVLAKAATYQP